ncbi:hypothetical protein RDWZM_002927 [Blomia tropicalis]|uniref:Dolichyl-diphosphooligosaccharide--protein glycosyltransferase subunit 1 n=1 Tax=Blomia tropicalis TaxID=40697 RepID=A0A9Q0MH94_BLOTA|nr:proteasome regulatory particle base subunit [Blomia tropicalis]KAJ6224382.1 hypothetical protein RDWZM_002927 [Blomia tropicalis]
MLAVRLAPCFILFFALISLHSILVSEANVNNQNENVVNVKVERLIDISTQLVKIVSTISVLNKGTVPLKEYIVQFGDSRHDEKLAYLLVSLVDSNKKRKQLVATKINDNGPFASYRVNFGSDAVEGGKSVQLEVEATFSHLLNPYPEEIIQSEKQLVVYKGRVYFPTPYTTETQTTRVKLASSTGVESYSKVRPVATADRFINYGPYDKIAPTSTVEPTNTEEELRVHVENNTPFLTTERLERTIQVSHWAGAVSIEELLDVVHAGAKLKGSFSRYEFQREFPSNGQSSIRGWKTRLPVGAFDIYYRDEIGNISTSNVRYTPSSVNVDIRPRFPLFGGWKTQYTLGYTLPSSNNLFTQEGSSFTSSNYVLKVPFIDHIYDDMTIDEATVKIILPEGASNFKLNLPYDVKRQSDEVYYSYLDTIGRPVIVLTKKNLVEWHIQQIEVRYTYKPLYLLQEPLLVVGSIFSLCLLVIGLVRTKTTLDGK